MKTKAHGGELLINPRTWRTSVFPSISISDRTADDSMKDNSPTYIIIQKVPDVKKKREANYERRRKRTQSTLTRGCLINLVDMSPVRKYNRKHA